MTPQRPESNTFRGFNNVADPLKLGWEWQVQADNVEITNRRALQRARGYAKITTNSAITGAYATDDMQRLYVVDAGELRRMDPGLATYSVLRTGIDPVWPMYFDEVNGVVFFTNGIDYGRLDVQGAKDWGVDSPAQAPQLAIGTGILRASSYSVCCTLRSAEGIESGNGPVATLTVPDGSAITAYSLPRRAGFDTNVYVTRPDATKPFFQLADAVPGDSVTYNCLEESLGMELPFWLLDAPRRGNLPQFFNGSMWVAEWMPTADITVLWRSEPFHYHHFDYGSEAKIIPGRGLMLRATKTHLLAGTERAVHAIDLDDNIETIANYGVVPGVHAWRTSDRAQVYWWSLRGLCRAMPFQNLTLGQMSVAPGLSAAGAVLEQAGNTRYVVALRKGGVAFNPRST